MLWEHLALQLPLPLGCNTSQQPLSASSQAYSYASEAPYIFSASQQWQFPLWCPGLLLLSYSRTSGSCSQDGAHSFTNMALLHLWYRYFCTLPDCPDTAIQPHTLCSLCCLPGPMLHLTVGTQIRTGIWENTFWFSSLKLTYSNYFQQLSSHLHKLNSGCVRTLWLLVHRVEILKTGYDDVLQTILALQENIKCHEDTCIFPLDQLDDYENQDQPKNIQIGGS